MLLYRCKINRRTQKYVMYNFNVYWTSKLKIEFLQRVVLIHSYLYYELDNPVWSDKKFDEISKQLVEEQNEKSKQWLINNTMYGYCFYDFDGSTGFDLWNRLEEKDKLYISNIAKSRW